MAFNGSGTYNRLYNWQNDRDANVKIRADRMDAEMDGMATGLSSVIHKGGQTTLTANIPFAGYKITGYGSTSTPSARTDVPSLGQVQDGLLNWVDGGGTADAITASYSPAITTLVDGQICYVRATAANATNTPTFSPNSLTARTIVKLGGQALAVGDIVGDSHFLSLRYDLSNTQWELLNPQGLSMFGSFYVLKMTDAGATTGPSIIADRNSASPAASDNIGEFASRGRNDAAEEIEYASWHGVILDPADGSEDGRVDIETIVAGTVARRLSIGQGTFTPNATGGDQGADTINASGVFDDGVDVNLETVIIPVTSETGAAATGTSLVKFRMPFAMTLTGVKATLGTAQSSGNILTVDINESGTTVLSTEITIDNAEKTSSTATTPAVISDSALANDAEITIDVDQIGDGTAVGLKVYLTGKRV